MTTETLDRPSSAESNAARARITESDLRRMFPRARADYIRVLAAGTEMLAEYGILDNEARWCAFIANIAAETGGLTIVRENMRYSATNLLAVWPNRYPNTALGRRRARSHSKRGARFIANYNYGFRLGNRGRKTNDGYDFRGALFLQATGRTQAVWLQQQTGVPYVDDPQHFDQVDENALRIACLTWSRQALGDLNTWADRGLFRACCNGINRGNPRSNRNPIGWADRQAAHARALRIWSNDAVPAPASSSADVMSEGAKGWEVEKYQERLKALGYQVGTIDGEFGDNTTTAVTNFQRVNNLTADGIIGPATRAALVSVDALPKPLSDTRAETTAADLAATGSRTVGVAQAGRVVSGAIGATGAGWTILDVLQTFNKTTTEVRSAVEAGSKNIAELSGLWPLGLIVIALVLWQMFGHIILARLGDHQTGANNSR